MSLGRWLDDAYTRSENAAAAIDRHGIPVTDLLAAFYARDRAWISLARLADLIRGARRPRQGSLAAAARELADVAAAPIRLISAGAHAAVIRPLKTADVRLAVTGTVAQMLIDGADDLAIAADILATHVDPRSEYERALRLQPAGDPAANALAPNPHLTMIGASIAGGVDRNEAVGELARIAEALVRVDQTLVRGDSPATAYLGSAEADHLRRWVSGAFPPFFAAHAARAGPAVLLRQIEPATAADRPAGPRVVDDFPDVLRTVTDISTAIKRHPRVVTARLLVSVARIGFGSEILAGRIAGEEEPSPQTVARATRWKDVARAAAQVRDLRDAEFPAYAQEAEGAANWIRDQARRWPDMAPRAQFNLSALERQLAVVAAQSIEPWRRALAEGNLLTEAVDGLSTQPHNGIKLAELTWKIAGPLDPQGRDVLHHLADAAANAHPALTRAAKIQERRLRREEASAGHGPNAGALQSRRRHLRLAVNANEIAARAQQRAAHLHAQLEKLRSNHNYTEEPPRTVAQKALRKNIDSLERELARQQQRSDGARTDAALHAQAAELPAGRDPAQALQQLEDEWSTATQAAVARDIHAERDAPAPRPDTAVDLSGEQPILDAAQVTAADTAQRVIHRDLAAGAANVTERQRNDAENAL